jgi:hypothetical protein
MTVRARPVFIAALYAALSVLLCARVFAQPTLTVLMATVYVGGGAIALRLGGDSTFLPRAICRSNCSGSLDRSPKERCGMPCSLAPPSR